MKNNTLDSFGGPADNLQHYRLLVIIILPALLVRRFLFASLDLLRDIFIKIIFKQKNKILTGFFLLT